MWLLISHAAAVEREIFLMVCSDLFHVVIHFACNAVEREIFLVYHFRRNFNTHNGQIPPCGRNDGANLGIGGGKGGGFATTFSSSHSAAPSFRTQRSGERNLSYGLFGFVSCGYSFRTQRSGERNLSAIL